MKAFLFAILLVPLVLQAQTGRPTVVLDTVADAMAHRARPGEEIAIRNYSASVGWPWYRNYTATAATNAHDGVHYITNKTAGLVFISADRTDPVQLPEWWGAAVDDGVDDSAAIKSALTWGPTVQLSAGVYNVGGNVSSGTAITIPSNRSLRGVPGTKIAIARSEGPHIANGIRIASATNVVVSGIELYATPAVTNMAAYTYGVLVLSSGVQTRDILIEDCIAHDLTTGFDIAGSGTHAVANATLSRSIAYRCINNGAQGVFGDGIKVLDCEFYGNGGTGGAGYGFDLETNSGETTSNAIFARNRSYGNVVGGLAAVAGLGSGGTNIVFIENELWNNPYGINVNGHVDSPYNGVTLIGNKFHQNSVRGFVVSRSRQVKITGNASDGDDSNAVDGIAHIDISGNTLRNSTNEALEFQSASMTLYANVTGNMIYRPGNRGINAALVGQSVFSGNVIEGAGTDGFFLSGSDNRIADNQIIGAGRSAEGTYVGLAVSGSRNAVGGNVVRKFPRFAYGYAQAATNNTITLSANSSGQNGFFTNAWVGIIQGTGAGQLRQITNYNGSTQVATVSTNWSTNPTTNSVYQIGLVDLTVVSGTPTATTSDTATLGTWATGSSQRYTGGFIRVTAGTGAGQERLITSYTSGREATINTAWTTQPDTNSTLVVSVPRGAWRGFVVVGESQVASDNNFIHGGMALDFLDAGTGTSLSPKILLSEAAPTFGTYRAGDIAFNSDPDSGEPSYWVCSVSGDPGTWTAGSSVGSGSLPASPSTGDLAYYNGSTWSGLNIGTNGTYLGVSSSALAWLPMTSDSLIIDGRTEALNEMLYVDGGENIILRPHRSGGLSTSVYIEALRGGNSARFTYPAQYFYASNVQAMRISSSGVRIQPAGVSADPSYALDVVGTSSLDGNVTISNGSTVTIGGESRTNWPPVVPTVPAATAGSLLYGSGTNWANFGIGSDNDYLRVSGGAPDWEPLTTARVTISGRTEALSDMLLVDGGENIYLRPHRSGGLSTSVYIEALQGGRSARFTYPAQYFYASNSEAMRITSSGVIIGSTNVVESLAGKQPLDADLSAFAAGTAIPTAQTNAVSWSAPLLYVGTTNVAQALSGKQASASILYDLSSIIPSLGALLYYNGANWVRFLPGTDGYVLKSSGGTIQWLAESGGGGSGTITNVALAVPSGFTVSGSPLTGGGGTITIGGVLGTSAGGTGITNATPAGQALLAAADAAAQRALLSVTNYQAGTGLQLSGTSFSHRIEAGTNIVLTTNGSALVINSTASSSGSSSNIPVVKTLLVSGTSITNSVATTNEVSQISTLAMGSTNVAANTASAGTTYRLKAAGRLTAAGANYEGTFRFRVGGVTASVTFNEPHSYTPSNVGWELEANITVLGTGSSAAVRVFGNLIWQGDSEVNDTLGAILRDVSGSGTFNTTAATGLEFTYQNDPTSALTLITDGAVIEQLGQEITFGAGGSSGVGTTNLVTTSTNGLAPAASADSFLGTTSAGAVQWFTRSLATNVFWGTPGTNTWTIPTNFLCGYVTCIGGGGGGASGGRRPTNSLVQGGTPGGGGGVNERWITANDLGTNTTITVVVGSGGAGGAGFTGDSASGNNGTSGGNSSFGPYLLAVGGTGGTGIVAAYPVDAAPSTRPGGHATAGGTSSSTLSAIVSPYVPFGMGGTGISTSESPQAFNPAYPFAVAAPPGLDPSGRLNGGGNGSSAGLAGTNGVSTSLSGPYPGGGGGGGRSSVSANGGSGGNGGNYGAGGGGGGATRPNYTSGAGGNGGSGCVHIMYITR